MDDDKVFDRSMASLGVTPLAGRRPAESAADLEADLGEDDQEDDQEDDRLLFEQAMRDLDASDRETPAGAPRRPVRPKVRRLKSVPRNLRVDDQVDLHGLRAEAALLRLDSFIAEAAGSGLRTVLVITGKGHHSPGGRGILRQRVEEWLHHRGRQRVQTWSEAPSRLGGRGALVLYLRAASD